MYTYKYTLTESCSGDSALLTILLLLPPLPPVVLNIGMKIHAYICVNQCMYLCKFMYIFMYTIYIGDSALLTILPLPPP